MADLLTLASLPAELKGLIVHECDDATLLTFRVAIVGDCYFQTAAYDAFGARFLRKRKHFVTAEGLQALVDITGHPTLGRYVEDIVLYPFELAQHFRPHSVALGGPQELTESAQERSRFSVDGLLIEALRITWSDWACEVTELHGKENSVLLLAKALTKVREKAARVTLSIYSPTYDPQCPAYRSPMRGVYGYRAVIQRLECLSRANFWPERLKKLPTLENFRCYDQPWMDGEDLTLPGGPRALTDATTYGPNSPRDVSNLLLAVLAESQVTPDALSFTTLRAGSSPPGLLHENTRFFSVSAAFSKITTLSLTFDIGYRLEWWRSRIEAMATLCHQAVHLTDLTPNLDTEEIGIAWREEDENLTDLVACFNNCPLQKLKMMHFCVNNADMTIFLRQHASTLNVSDIERAKTQTPESALSLIGVVRESNLQLNHLGFKQLVIIRDRDGANAEALGHIWSAQYDGVETIEKALAEIARHPEIVVGGPVDDVDIVSWGT